eukprot:TRINITY_DN21932_c0_g1_i1.p1 TRINITY_DN21932_c0_g1~~TRINITY_DN21932_c0_g1_i1.p1  ORF type:complete len:105 (+),score=29.79 TRINITY_DN21932_c0_g1_i1:39-317(+)
MASNQASVSAAQEARAKELFNKFDVDHNGTIEAKEFSSVLKELNIFENASLVDTYAEMIFSSNDKDKSGKLDWAEFLSLYKKVLEKKIEHKI